MLRLPDSVIAAVRSYRDAVAQYRAGRMGELPFKAYRVPMGVYEQRQDGSFMVRVRVGAGLLHVDQARCAAGLAARHGSGTVHLTTRQDLQIHDLELEDTIAVQEGLLEVGLSGRGGGGNTVRNIGVDPMSGLHPEEAFDVAPYAIACTEYLLDFDDSFNLPRKLKISYSATAEDTAFAAVADLGFFALNDNGRPVFQVRAGGGLGPNPRLGTVVCETIAAEDHLLVAEAVKRVFDAHGDRSNKHAARLRYVLKRLGVDVFRAQIHSEIERLRADGLPAPAPALRPLLWQRDAGSPAPDDLARHPAVRGERQPGYYTLALHPVQGMIAACALTAVADLAQRHGDPVLRCTHTQGLLITGIPGGQLPGLMAALRDADIALPDQPTLSITTCAGASTCKLGLCLSRALATAISDHLASQPIAADAPAVRVSGCPNSCGNHLIAAIGLEGRARRVNGRLMPHYEILVGGRLHRQASRFAGPVGVVPAKAVPQAIAALLAAPAQGDEAARTVVAPFTHLPDPIPEDWFHDWGAEAPFSLAGRGPGECSVGTMDIMRVDLDAAARHLEAAPSAADDAQRDASVYAALVAICRSLLPIHGLEPDSDRAVFTAAREHLVDPGWVDPGIGSVLDHAIEWKMGERPSLHDLLPAIVALHERVDALFRSLDGNLRFRLEPLVAPAVSAAPAGGEALVELDLRGVPCPLNFVKAKIRLEQMPVEAVLEVLLDDGEPIANVPASFQEQGQEIISQNPEGPHHRLRVRRRR